MKVRIRGVYLARPLPSGFAQAAIAMCQRIPVCHHTVLKNLTSNNCVYVTKLFVGCVVLRHWG
jgi:hypothetical protein